MIAYKDAKKLATAETKTAGEPGKLKLDCDRNEVRADGLDLSFVTLTSDGLKAATATIQARRE